MLMRLHIREVIDIDVPDFIALDTLRCSRHQSNRWTMRRDWHDEGNDLDCFLDSAVREALMAKMRKPTDRLSPLLRGWYEKPDCAKEMP